MSKLRKDDLIIKDIKLKIYGNKLKMGSFISERKIAETYAVSRGTARKALESLQNQEILTKIPSIGYRINARRTDTMLAISSSFSSHMNIYKEGFDKLKVSHISHKWVKDNQEVAKIGRINSDVSFWLLLTLNIRNSMKNKITSFVQYYVPENVNFNIDQYLTTSLSPLTFISKDTQHVSKMHTLLKLVQANVSTAKLLNIPVGATIVQRTCTFTSTQKKVLCIAFEYSLPKNAVSISPANIIFRKVGGFIE